LTLPRRPCLGDQPLLVKDPPHRCRRDPQRLEAPKHVADPPRSPLGVLLPQRCHRVASDAVPVLPPWLRPDLLGFQCRRASLVVPVQPHHHRRRAQAEDPTDLAQRYPLLPDLTHHAKSERLRVDASRSVAEGRLPLLLLRGSPGRLLVSLLRLHLSR